MNSMQRVLTALSHKEPDRVLLFLLTSLQGAKELELSIEDYYSRADYVVEGQMRLLKKYRGDCLFPFFYVSIELEPWGGKVIFQPDCPPNAGAPIIHRPEDIDRLHPPRVADASCLARVLDTIRQLKARVGDTIPIMGVATSPFSLPVIQMGSDRYIELIYEQPERLVRLMQANEEFCVEWSNAELAAGATAIYYFGPVSSCTVIPRELYLKTGQQIVKRTLARLGDEFVAVLVDLECPQDYELVLKRLLQAADPVIVNEAVLHVPASIGVKVYPQDGADADQLMRHADQAMYQAKQAGKNHYHLFDVDQGF